MFPLFCSQKHTTLHTHTTNQRNRRFYNSLLSSFPFPGSSCAASTQQRVQGTTPRIDEPLVPSPNLNEMNVEELDKERAIKLWQLTIFHPFRSEVVSFNVSVIEKKKRARRGRSHKSQPPVLCRPLFAKEVEIYHLTNT